MFAKYVVLKLKGKAVPILVSPSCSHGWDRPKGESEVDMSKVLGAGFITWNEGSSDVACFGEGVFHVGCHPFTRKVRRASRGEVDTALFRELLSRPIRYVVLNLDHAVRVTFVRDSDDHARPVLRYQVYASRCVVSAGVVDFGLTTGKSAVCSGSAEFDRESRKPFVSESRGNVDLKLMQDYFVEQ